MKLSVLWVIIFCILSLLAGIFLGIAIQSNCSIDIDNKVRYSELINWFFTIIIGIWVGYFLKNQFENNKSIKSFLLDDLKNILSELQAFNSSFTLLKNQDSFEESTRQEINSKLNLIDKKILVFSTFLEENFKKQHKEIEDRLIRQFNDLNRCVTGDDLYSSKIPTNYFDNITAQSSKFETEIKRILSKIVKEF